MVNPLSQIGNRLRTRHLKLLLVLDECASLRKAAEIMSLTQPALTKNLHEIEELVGESLFTRTPKGIEPNVLGQAMIRYARLVFTDLDGLHKELSALKGGNIGTIHIGGIMVLATTLLPKTIAAVKKEHPLLNMTVEVETSDVLLKALESGKLDLVIARIPENYPAGNLDFIPFDAETIVPVARFDHPEMQNRSLTLETLREYCWIIQAEPAPLRTIYHQIFREAHTRLPANTLETSSSLLSLALLQQSDMISLQPLSLVASYEAVNQIGRLPISLATQMNAYGLVTRKNRMPTAAMAVVAEAFQRQVIQA